MSKSLTKKKIIELSKIHDNKYSYDKFEYTKSSNKILVKCKEHGYFSVTYNNHYSRKSGCPECKKKTSDNYRNFIKKSKEHFGNMFEYDPNSYINNRTKMKIKCKEHGWFYSTPQTHLSNKFGCKECNKEITLIEKKQIYVSKSSILHNNKYDYSKVDYQHYHKRVIICCPKHGDFTQSFHVHLKGHGCPSCSSSYGEISVEKYLKNNNIKYTKEYSFKDCKNINILKFDFYLPDYNICIEYDGIQHFEEVEFFRDSLEDVKFRDKIKNEYCIKNNIHLIRIGYTDNLDKILNNNFKTIG